MFLFICKYIIFIMVNAEMNKNYTCLCNSGKCYFLALSDVTHRTGSQLDSRVAPVTPVPLGS